MANQNNEDSHDIFIANSTYPVTKSIFTRLQTLNEIKDDCYVVLDTNVLLTPYIIGKEDLLDQCRRTFKPLSAEKRLIVPGQVAREFAKNRAIKIAELYQQITRKQVPSMQKGKHPLLSALEEYEEVVRLEGEIDEKLNEYRQAFKKAVDNVKSRIQEWRWNDPVSVLYSEIFDENTIVDPLIDKEAVQKDLAHRQFYKLPPGYKDSTKADSGIGDLLIWYTILEVGKTKKKSVLFVSGDEKADWYLRGEGGQALYPRYELVDEFRRHSEGQTFHIVKFSEFLELFEANEKVVKEVQQEEVLSQRKGRVGRITSNWAIEAGSAIVNWLTEAYEGFDMRVEVNKAPGSPDLFLINSQGSIEAGVEVRFLSDVRDSIVLIKHLTTLAVEIKGKFQAAMLFLIYPDEISVTSLENIIENALLSTQIQLSKGISLIIGYFNGDEFQFVNSFGSILP